MLLTGVTEVARMRIEIGTLKFDVVTAGDPGGEPVLLLHGFPQNAHTWRHQLPVLAQRGYFAMAPDQRGYSAGARPSGIESYASDKLVDDALSIAEHFGARAFHLVGHDWGGQLAWLTAAYHPDRVRTLTVLSRPHPEAFRRAMETDEQQAGRSGHHRAFQAEDAADRLLADGMRALKDSLMHQGVALEDVAAYLDGLSTKEALDAAINWYRAPRSQLAREIPSVERPTLYVWGDQDATVGRIAALATEEFVRAPYSFVELEGVGHFITDQAPDAVNAALLTHLAANRA